MRDQSYVEWVTVQEMLQFEALKPLQLLAGHGGIGRKITSVNVMEVPDIEGWVTADQLLLTTAFSIKDDAAALNNLIPLLAQKGLAGIVIKSRYLEDIPPEMIAAANEYNFPLLEMPASFSHATVIQDIYSAIMNKQIKTINLSAQLRQDMMNIVINGGNFSEICSMLYDLYKFPIWITDSNWNIQASSSENKEVFSIVRSAIVNNTDFVGTISTSRRVLPFPAHANSSSIIYIPVYIRNFCHGYIIALAEDDRITSNFIIALEQSAIISALLFSNRIALQIAQARYINAFLLEWLSGKVTREEQLYDLAGSVGWEIENNYALILVSPLEQTVQPASKSFEIDSILQNSFANTLFYENYKYQMGSVGQSVVILVKMKTGSSPASVNNQTRKLIEKLHDNLPKDIIHTVKFSTGHFRPYFMDMPKCYAEAVNAFSVGSRFTPDEYVYIFDSLGIYSFMYSVDPQERARIIEELYTPLVEYDNTHNSELIKTLKAYYKCDTIIAHVAKELFLHYNTVKYRLKSIEQLTGIDLKNSSDRLLLHIALMLGECQ